MEKRIKKQLYAVAAEHPVWINGRLMSYEPEIVHVHAFDAANARYIFMTDPKHARARIVAIGPVVGFHVLDNHGERLLA